MEHNSPPRNRTRRSSILKAPRARSPLQCLEANQDVPGDEDRTTMTRTTTFKRRVSFSRTNRVQEFCLENQTTHIWGEAYEKAMSPEKQTRNMLATLQSMQPPSFQSLIKGEINVTALTQFDTENVMNPSTFSSQSNMPGTFVPQTSSVVPPEVVNDDMDITGSEISQMIPPPAILGQVINKENMNASGLPSFLQQSYIERSGETSNTPFLNFPNVKIEDEDISPDSTCTKNLLNKTCLEDSLASSDMSTCSLVGDNGADAPRISSDSSGDTADLLDKPLKFLGRSTTNPREKATGFIAHANLYNSLSNANTCVVDPPRNFPKSFISSNSFMASSEGINSVFQLNKTNFEPSLNDTQLQTSTPMQNSSMFDFINSQVKGKDLKRNASCMDVDSSMFNTCKPINQSYGPSNMPMCYPSIMNPTKCTFTPMVASKPAALDSSAAFNKNENSSITDSKSSIPSSDRSVNMDLTKASCMNSSSSNLNKSNMETTWGLKAQPGFTTMFDKSIVMDTTNLDGGYNNSMHCSASQPDQWKKSRPMNQQCTTLILDKSTMNVTKSDENILQPSLNQQKMMGDNSYNKTSMNKSDMDITRAGSTPSLNSDVGNRSVLMDITKVTPLGDYGNSSKYLEPASQPRIDNSIMDMSLEDTGFNLPPQFVINGTPALDKSVMMDMTMPLLNKTQVVDSTEPSTFNKSVMMDMTMPSINKTQVVDSTEPSTFNKSVMMDMTMPLLNKTQVVDSTEPSTFNKSVMMDMTMPSINKTQVVDSTEPSTFNKSVMMDMTMPSLNKTQVVDSTESSKFNKSVMMDMTMPSLNKTQVVDSTEPSTFNKSAMMDMKMPSSNKTQVVDSVLPSTFNKSVMMDMKMPSSNKIQVVDSTEPSTLNKSVVMDMTMPSLNKTQVVDSTEPSMLNKSVVMDMTMPSSNKTQVVDSVLPSTFNKSVMMDMTMPSSNKTQVVDSTEPSTFNKSVMMDMTMPSSNKTQVVDSVLPSTLNMSVMMDMTVHKTPIVDNTVSAADDKSEMLDIKVPLVNKISLVDRSIAIDTTVPLENKISSTDIKTSSPNKNSAGDITVPPVSNSSAKDNTESLVNNSSDLETTVPPVNESSALNTPLPLVSHSSVLDATESLVNRNWAMDTTMPPSLAINTSVSSINQNLAVHATFPENNGISMDTMASPVNNIYNLDSTVPTASSAFNSPSSQIKDYTVPPSIHTAKFDTTPIKPMAISKPADIDNSEVSNKIMESKKSEIQKQKSINKILSSTMNQSSVIDNDFILASPIIPSPISQQTEILNESKLLKGAEEMDVSSIGLNEDNLMDVIEEPDNDSKSPAAPEDVFHSDGSNIMNLTRVLNPDEVVLPVAALTKTTCLESSFSSDDMNIINSPISQEIMSQPHMEMNRVRTETQNTEESCRTELTIENNKGVKETRECSETVKTKYTSVVTKEYENSVMMEKSTVNDGISNEKCEIENCEVVKTYKADKNSPNVDVTKYHITEDFEDVVIDGKTGEISHKVKHLDIQEIRESPHAEQVEFKVSSTTVELNSNQELFLSPRMDKHLSIATIIDMQESPSDKVSSCELKRRSTECTRDESSQAKKTRRQVIHPDIIITTPTPTEVITLLASTQDDTSEDMEIISNEDITDAAESQAANISEHNVKILSSKTTFSFIKNEANVFTEENMSESEDDDNAFLIDDIEIQEDSKPLVFEGPFTFEDYIKEESKRHKNIWCVSSLEPGNWKFSILNKTALICLKHIDYSTQEISLLPDPNVNGNMVKGARMSWQLCLRLLKRTFSSEQLLQTCPSVTGVQDLFEYLASTLLSLSQLGQDLSIISAECLLAFGETSVQFHLKSFKLKTALCLVVDLTNWQKIELDHFKFKFVCVQNKINERIVHLIKSFISKGCVFPQCIETFKNYIRTMETLSYHHT